MIEPPRVTLAQLPTPLVPMPRLGQALGGANLWVKRDDLTGLEVSGNKVRKLEYIIAEMQANGDDTLVTEGTCQSNHCRATAAVCARLGLQAVLLFRPLPPEKPQGNHLLDTLFGAQARAFTREDFRARKESIVNDVLSELRAAGRKPRWTPAGASEPLGCWGYVRALGELRVQLHAAEITACDVILPISSAGTYAGAVLGRLIHGLDQVRLWAVPVSDDVAYHQAEVTRLVTDTIAQFKLPLTFGAEPGATDLAIATSATAQPIPTGERALRDPTPAAPRGQGSPAASASNLAGLDFLDGYVGEGYAKPYAAALDALQLLARTEALILDPVYTAKAFCAFLDGVRNGRFGRARPAIFWHTGGIFSNFAWPDVLLG